MTPLLLGIITVAALILAGVLGTVEAAVSSISRARVETMVKDEVAGAPTLLGILDRRADHINLLVLLRTLLEVTAAVFAAGLFIEVLPDYEVALAVAIAVVALILFAIIGVCSRTMGRRNPYSISLRSGMLLSVFTTLMRPIIKLLIWAGNIVAPGPGFRDGPYSTEIELREMVDIAQEHGVVEIEERRMIQSIFDLAGTPARQVMVPRPEMIWIEGDKHAGQATALCVRSGHSRIPVVGENTDDIIGVVYLKDLVQRTYSAVDGGRSVTVAEVMREASFVPDSKPLDALLHEMQASHNHIVMLVDEFGGISGLVSMEDILEEIVGEIADEYDEREMAPIEHLGQGAYRCVGRLPLVDLIDRIKDDRDVELEFSAEVADQVDTVAGLIAYHLGRVPLPGARVEADGLRLTAEGGRDRRGRMRVCSVVVEVLADTPDSELKEA